MDQLPTVYPDGTIRVVVACVASDGTPTFAAVRILCTREEYSNGDHYDTAKEQCVEDNYEGEASMLAYDENDGPAWLFAHFYWSDAPLAQVGVG